VYLLFVYPATYFLFTPTYRNILFNGDGATDSEVDSATGDDNDEDDDGNDNNDGNGEVDGDDGDNGDDDDGATTTMATARRAMG